MGPLGYLMELMEQMELMERPSRSARTDGGRCTRDGHPHRARVTRVTTSTSARTTARAGSCVEPSLDVGRAKLWQGWPSCRVALHGFASLRLASVTGCLIG
jgi:hypothetical protein